MTKLASPAKILEYLPARFRIFFPFLSLFFFLVRLPRLQNITRVARILIFSREFHNGLFVASVVAQMNHNCRPAFASVKPI